MSTSPSIGGADERRRIARALAEHALWRGEPVAWFEELYAAAEHGRADVPWADGAASPQLAAWLAGGLALPAPPTHGRALVVGCGFGDDAALLAQHGYDVTAFDIAPTVVKQARARFEVESLAQRVQWCCANLLDLEPSWRGAFDLVVEINTLQVLPPPLRARATQALVDAVAPGGQIFVCARGREANEARGTMPWPLSASELDEFERLGLAALARLELVDDEVPPVRRFVALFASRA